LFTKYVTRSLSFKLLRSRTVLVYTKALNKNRQFAPTGPDGKTAARFRRRCGKRYAAFGVVL